MFVEMNQVAYSVRGFALKFPHFRFLSEVSFAFLPTGWCCLSTIC
uniref:Uncharacterized protein n=1 Tax=Anguilla anguilla TaxID=7936 RepID=A0A0E9W4X1_ANGAN